MTAVAIEHHPPTQVECNWGVGGGSRSALPPPHSDVSSPHSKGVSSTRADQTVPA